MHGRDLVALLSSPVHRLADRALRRSPADDTQLRRLVAVARRELLGINVIAHQLQLSEPLLGHRFVDAGRQARVASLVVFQAGRDIGLWVHARDCHR